MIIRKLELADYSAMLVLYKALDELHVEARPDYFIHRDEVFPQEHYSAAISDPKCLLLGAFDTTDKMVAFVRATLWNESGMVKTLRTACLDNIYVLPSYRRNGIATQLFRKVEHWAKDKSAVRLDLHTWDFNKDALAMYQAMGMEPQRYVLEKKL